MCLVQVEPRLRPETAGKGCSPHSPECGISDGWMYGLTNNQYSFAQQG